MSPANEPDWQKTAEQLFETFDAYDQITRPKQASARKPGFHELFKYATDPAYTPSDHLVTALKTDFKLNRDLRLLVSKHALIEMPKAAAASSGEISEREADGFMVRLKVSQANPDQVYLIIEAEERDEIPRFIFAAEQDGPLHRLVIDDYLDGQAQILLEGSADIVKALRNVNTRVTLGR